VAVVGLPLLMLMFYDAYDPHILPKGILAVSVLQILTIPASVVLFAVHDPAARKNDALCVIVSTLKNPLVIGAGIGLIFNVLGITLPTFAATTADRMGGIVMPLAMICVGANILFHGFGKKFKYVAIATAIVCSEFRRRM
jgi:predicted permease